MNTTKTLVVISSIALLSGCAGMGPDQTGGTILGAGGGALLGSEFGGTGGAVIGAAAGALGGNYIGKELDRGY